MSKHNDEIELRDILTTLLEYKDLLFKNIRSIILFSALFFVLGVVYVTFISSIRYNAELTFVVQGDSNVGFNSMSGLASQFGFDIGGVTSDAVFSQNNVIELLRTRGVVDKVLMQSAKINNKEDLLINHYIDINNKDFLFYGNSYTKDSVRRIIWEDIVEDHLDIQFQSDQANLITLSYISLNEEFAKHFVDKLIDQMSKRYIAHQTAQANNSLDFLQDRADSVFSELKIAEEEFAKIQDINTRIVKASGRLKELQLRRRVQVLNAMYLELVKNLEISKVTLLNKTPIINIVDKPILPLENDKISKILAGLLGFFIGGFLSVFYFIFRKLFLDALR